MADPNPVYANALRAALDAQGVTDPETRAGMAAIAMGESNMLGYVEMGYAHTSNDRIRQVFGSRVSGLSDAELDEIKADDKIFFEHVYGSLTNVGRGLGNTQPGDGYKFRGRYAIQITGRGNYQRYATKSGHPEIMDNPDLGISDPSIGMAICVAYIVDRYHGGGFDAMLRAVGNNTPDIAATKQAWFDKFMASGEFAQMGSPQPAPPVIPPVIEPEPLPSPMQPNDDAILSAIRMLQQAFKDRGFYKGPIDGDWGDGTEAAFQAWQATL